MTGHPDVAFVQTVKVADVADGDPFGNNNPGFYRTTMAAMHAAKAVYPCGSGLVWRRTALHDIGRFPEWNLVEDCDSGVLAMKRGWRGAFVPIVGAVGQTAPEDLPNVIKQRGTWALDAMRLMFWRRLGGLQLRQRLFFYEIFLYYFSAVTNAVFCVALIANLIVRAPLIELPPLQLAIVYLATSAIWLSFDFSDAVATRFEGVFRQRQLMLNLAPVFARAIVVALVMGPNRKPRYTVTRKTHEHSNYLSMITPNVVAGVLLALGVVVNLVTAIVLGWPLDVTSIYFALIYCHMIWSFVPRAWWGCGRQLSDTTIGSRLGDRLSTIQQGMSAPLGKTALSTARPQVAPIEWTAPRAPVTVSATLGELRPLSSTG